MSQFNPGQSQFPICSLTLNSLLSLAAHFSHTALFCPHTDQMISAPSRWTDHTLTSRTHYTHQKVSDWPWSLDYPLYLWQIFECAYLVLRLWNMLYVSITIVLTNHTRHLQNKSLKSQAAGHTRIHAHTEHTLHCYTHSQTALWFWSTWPRPPCSSNCRCAGHPSEPWAHPWNADG